MAINGLRLVTAKSLERKDGKLYAFIEDSSFDNDKRNSTSVEVLLPPGLTVDYDKEQEVPIKGWYGDWAGKKYFMIDMFSECPLENINGTILYHIQDSSINIQLNENKIVLQATEDTEIIMEKDEPLSIKSNGVSLYKLLTDLIKEIKDLQTYGSPANHKVSPDSIVKFESLQTNVLDKILK